MKYLDVADFHYNPNRKEECIEAFSKIIKASADVDFVVFSGDLFDLPVYANDDLNVLLDLMHMINKPCCGVCGTQGHEVRSMYRALVESVGFVLMEPGVEYGFIDGKIIKIFPDNKNIPSVLLYGLDEISKKSVMAHHPELKPNEVNPYINNLLKKLITEDIAAKRSRLPDVPAVLVVHGNISDAVDRNAEKNEALKRADIVIKTEWIKEADITYTSAGHIHQYINFEKINGGYGGSPAWNWNSTGFLPCFNQVNIIGGTVTVDRIPYGTPERRKIYKPLEKYESNIAYWLEYDGDLNLNPAEHGAHPWSRMTLPEKEKTTRRVDIADVENKPLAEIAEIFDKNITASQKEKLTEAEKARTQGDRLSRTVRVESVEVENCVLFHDKKLDIKLSDITGLTQIIGENGSGKSSVLSFCTPYPVLVGKDTESGRSSAIKDFFKNETGKIRKLITVNGIEHEHIILLNKGKCECFLNIGGRPALERSNFDEFFSRCEKEYGALNDYITTSFYVQPLQGKTESGLMTASQTTVRDIVQNIAGINREEEKQYCLSRVAEYEGKIKEVQTRIDILSEDKNIIADLQKKLPEAEYDRKNSSDNVIKLEAELKTAEAELNIKSALKEENDKKLIQKESLKTTICKKFNEKTDAEREIKTLPELRVRRDSIAEQSKKYNEYLEKYSAWTEAESKKQGILSEVNKLKSTYENNLKLKESYEREISVWNKPCPNCGYICEDNKVHIDALNEKISALDLVEPNLDDLRRQYGALNGIIRPEVVSRPESVESINAQISVLEEKEKNIIMLEAEIKTLREQEKNISVEVIDITAERNRVDEISNKLRLERITKDMAEKTYLELETKIKAAQNNITEAERLTNENKADMLELDDWKYCADILRPNKIPAMELDAVLDTIDRKATDNLKGYRNGRYIVMTETQKEGKKSVVDKFDIKIFDTQTGEAKSFKNYSVGEKSFILGAYNNALLDIRKGKNNIDYFPVISDEQDAFIDKNNRAEFYKMNETKDMLLVSHSPDIENYIENKIKISEVLF